MEPGACSLAPLQGTYGLLVEHTYVQSCGVTTLAVTYSTVLGLHKKPLTYTNDTASCVCVGFVGRGSAAMLLCGVCPLHRPVQKEHKKVTKILIRWFNYFYTFDTREQVTC